MKRLVTGTAGLFWLCAASPTLAQTAAPPQTPAVPPVFRTATVAVTPLPGVELSPEDIAVPVQWSTAADIARSGALDLSSFLSQRGSAVHVNDLQGNPFQVDVSFRGFTASPLLGTPQGISVYMDGVRMNQPFGDTVSWDLFPRQALAAVTLIPGSNPVFGLNTLGGALALHTKDGLSSRGTLANVAYGAYGRRVVELEHGGSRADGRLHWYATGNLFHEDGWRDDSPSDVRQAFAKVGGRAPRFDWTMTGAYANNHLIGNGLQDSRLLDQDYASVYTKPDVTDNRSTFANVTAASVRPGPWSWSANAYVRRIVTDTLNGDINEGALDQSVYQPGAAERAALAAAGYAGVPTSGATSANTPFPSWRCIANALLRDEPAEKCNGLINRTALRQWNGGAAAQATRMAVHDDWRNRLTVGAAFDTSDVRFAQSTELGYLKQDRRVTGVGAFGDGVTGGNVDGEPFDTRVDLTGRTRTWSSYVTDTLNHGDRWAVTVAARFNRTSVANTDRILPGGGPGSLDADQVFQRLNPSVGVTFKPSPLINLYVGYGEGSRAPTSTELGCADPETPCKLPNAMAGDPPLKAVVTRTFEAGLRSGPASRTGWAIDVFRAENRQDIMFVTSAQSGFGYFANLGRTRRQGIDVSIERRVGRVAASASYTFLSATFESAQTMVGAGNSTNSEALAGRRGLEGTIEIRAGDRMPLIPRHILKANAEVDLSARWSVDIDVSAVSGVFARGNENNQHRADGTYYLGAGRTDAYVVADGAMRYDISRRVQVYATAKNIFNRRYATAAQLGSAALTAQGTFAARSLPAVGSEFPVPQTTFVAPGAPRLLQFGLRLRF